MLMRVSAWLVWSWRFYGVALGLPGLVPALRSKAIYFAVLKSIKEAAPDLAAIGKP